MIVRRAAIRLAAVYTVAQLLIFAAVAFPVYAFVTSSFDFDPAESDAATADGLAEAGFASLSRGLLLTFVGLLVMLPAVNYLLARVSLRPVARAYDAQQRFVDDASHEFRTPIAVLQGRLELATMRPRTTHEYEETLRASLTEVAGMADLTDQLLVLARGSDAQLRRSFTTVDVAGVVTDAIVAAGPQASAKVRSVDVFDGAQVRGVHDLLVRAVANLVHNAGKYTGDTGSIDILVRSRGRSIVIDVVDDGPGLDVEERRRAFDRFWRADSTRGSTGTGLGLSLVRQNAEIHRGRAELADAPGGGLSASIVLPVSTA